MYDAQFRNPMRFANQLTDKECKELFCKFVESYEWQYQVIKSRVERNESFIRVVGLVADNVTDNIGIVEISDYSLGGKIIWAVDRTFLYRQYMYDKFGEEYAKSFLLLDK